LPMFGGFLASIAHPWSPIRLQTVLPHALLLVPITAVSLAAFTAAVTSPWHKKRPRHGNDARRGQAGRSKSQRFNDHLERFR
jgi:hypothetical protein